MSYEAGMIVDAICEDACEICGVSYDGNTIEELRKRTENRISAFESELIAQTKNHIIEAVKAASV